MQLARLLILKPLSLARGLRVPEGEGSPREGVPSFPALMLLSVVMFAQGRGPGLVVPSSES